MKYLDFERLEKIDPEAFQSQRPYPWINPEGLIANEGFERLRATLPDLSMFERKFEVERKHGQ